MAVPAVVVSIMGLVCCGVLGPIGLIMGAVELNAIDKGRTDPDKRGAARAATIIGAVATLLTLGFVALVVLLATASTPGTVN
jgi:hypothetical protein